MRAREDREHDQAAKRQRRADSSTETTKATKEKGMRAKHICRARVAASPANNNSRSDLTSARQLPRVMLSFPSTQHCNCGRQTLPLATEALVYRGRAG